jgi:hypothetical protein
MKMVLSALAATLVALSFSAARADVMVDFAQLQNAAMAQAQVMAGLKWKVGDQADYTITVGSLVNGTSHEFVRSNDTANGLWVEQDMDLGMVGKQKIEEQFDPATGQIKQILANGQAQTIPSPSDYDIISMKQDTVTVAAGTFQCVHATIKSKKDGTTQDAWINPQLIPIEGMIKATGDTQLGAMVQELTKFQFTP